MNEARQKGPVRDIYQPVEPTPRVRQKVEDSTGRHRNNRRHSDTPHWLTGSHWFSWNKVVIAVLILLGLPLLCYVAFRWRDGQAVGKKIEARNQEVSGVFDPGRATAGGQEVESPGTGTGAGAAASAGMSTEKLSDQTLAAGYAESALDYLSRGELDQAAGFLRKALTLDPAKPERWSLFGQVLFRQQRYEEAADAFLEIIKRAPNQLDAYENLVRSYELTSKPERALQYSRRLRALDPGVVSVLLSEGTILAELGQYAEAKEILQQYVAQKPEDPVGLNNLGTVLLALGENAGAALVLQQALDLDPKIQGLYFNLAVVHARRDEVDTVVSWLERAKPFVPQPVLQEWVEDAEFDMVRGRVVFLRFIDSIGLRDPGLSDLLPVAEAPVPSNG